MSMNIIYMLISVSLLLMTVAGIGIYWAIRSGQYDDMDSPAHRILMDDDEHLFPDDAKPKKDGD